MGVDPAAAGFPESGSKSAATLILALLSALESGVFVMVVAKIIQRLPGLFWTSRFRKNLGPSGSHVPLSLPGPRQPPRGSHGLMGEVQEGPQAMRGIVATRAKSNHWCSAIKSVGILALSLLTGPCILHVASAEQL